MTLLNQIQIEQIVRTVAPTVSDDSSYPYYIGQVWTDSVTKVSYICTDNSVGAAQWDVINSTLSVVNTGRILWVDSVFGNNGTATPERLDKPYADPWAAITDASSGDCIKILQGTYTISTAASPNLIKSGVSIEAVGIVNIVNDSSHTDALFQSSVGTNPISIRGDIRCNSSIAAPICNITAGAIDFDINYFEIEHDTAASKFIADGSFKLRKLVMDPENYAEFVANTYFYPCEIGEIGLSAAGAFRTHSYSLVSNALIGTSDANAFFCIPDVTDKQAVATINFAQDVTIGADSGAGFGKVYVNNYLQTVDNITFEAASSTDRTGEIELRTYNLGTGSAITALFDCTGGGLSRVIVGSLNIDTATLYVGMNSLQENDVRIGSCYSTASSLLDIAGGGGDCYFEITPTHLVGDFNVNMTTSGQSNIKINPGKIDGVFGVTAPHTAGTFNLMLPTTGELLLAGAPAFSSPVTCYILFTGVSSVRRMVSGRIRTSFGDATDCVLYFANTTAVIPSWNIVYNCTFIVPSNFTYSIDGPSAILISGAGSNTFNKAYNVSNITFAGASPFVNAGVF